MKWKNLNNTMPFDKEGVARINLGENATAAELAAEEIRLGQEWEDTQYQRIRVYGSGSIYPSTGEQFDMLYHELETSGSLTTSGSWFKAITSVKDANPKPE
ncbi:MAG: hypothetical protein QF535_19965 [Anaerolineales bacterium]|nr:hypothetical protein [Anaerolineales bacterium]